MANGRNWFLRWFDADWYRYLRLRYPERLFFFLPALLALLAFAGYTAVSAMGSSKPATQSYVQLETTVIRTVKVREHGKVVIKRIPEIKHVYAKPVTVMQTHTVQTPGGTKIVTEPVVRYKPVYRRKVVLVHGKPVTVNQVVTDTKMLTDTQMLTVTNEHTVVNEHTSTVVNNQTVNQTQTITKTETAPTVTVTPDPVTVTERDTVTQPRDTVTVTTPGDTVTVTVTQTGP